MYIRLYLPGVLGLVGSDSSKASPSSTSTTVHDNWRSLRVSGWSDGVGHTAMGEERYSGERPPLLPPSLPVSTNTTQTLRSQRTLN